MKGMDREQVVQEIARVEQAMRKTDSPHLRRDYGKYLKRLYRDLKYYDKSMAAHSGQAPKFSV